MNVATVRGWVPHLQNWIDATNVSADNCPESDSGQERADWLQERAELIEACMDACTELIDHCESR